MLRGVSSGYTTCWCWPRHPTTFVLQKLTVQQRFASRSWFRPALRREEGFLITVRKLELDVVIEGVVALTRDLARASDAVKADTSDGQVEISEAMTRTLDVLNQLRAMRSRSELSPPDPHPAV